MKYITILLMFFASQASAQLMFVQPEQVPQWFPFQFNGVDSIGVIEQNGQSGGTYELLLVYPDTTFQFVNVVYDENTKAAEAKKNKLRTAEYLRNQIGSRAQSIKEQYVRDSIFVAKYYGVYEYLGQFIDTTIVEQPVDTGQ